MHILGWLVFGLIVGFIARLIMPGPQPMGCILTALLGIGGSFVGGAIGNLIHGQSLTEPVASGWIGSIVGALVLMWGVSLLRGRDRT